MHTRLLGFSSCIPVLILKTQNTHILEQIFFLKSFNSVFNCIFCLPAGQRISKKLTSRVSDMKILSLQAVVPDIQPVKNCAFLKSLSI